MGDTKQELLFELKAADLSGPGLDSGVARFQRAADEIAKIKFGPQLDLTDLIDAQGRAESFLKDLRIAGATGAERERLAIDSTVDAINRKISGLREEGADVSKLIAQTEKLRALQLERVDASENQRALDIAVRARDLQESILLAASEGADKQRTADRIVVQGIEDKIRGLEREGAQVDGLRASLEQLERFRASKADNEEQQRALDLAAQARDLQNALTLATADGADRERLAARITIEGIENKIAALGKEGASVSDLIAQTERLRALQLARVDSSEKQEVVTLEQQALAIETTRLARARDLAKARGDSIAVEQYSKQLAEAQARSLDLSATRQISALREQFRGRADVASVIDRTERSLRAQVEIEKQINREASQRPVSAPITQIGGSRITAALGQLGSQALGSFGAPGQAISQITREVSALNAGLDTTALAAGGSTTALLGIGVASASIAALGGLLAAAATQGGNLERSLENVQSFTKASSDDIARYKTEVRSLANSLGIDIAEIREAYSIAPAVGVREDVDKFVAQSARASVLGLGTTAEAVARLKSVLDGFKLPDDQLGRVVNTVFVGARESTASSAEFAQALASVSQEATFLKVPLESMAGVLASVTKEGVPANQAAAGLANLIVRLSRDSDPAVKQLRALGAAVGAREFQENGILKTFASVSAALDESNPKVKEFGVDIVALRSQVLGTGKFGQVAFNSFGDGAQSATRIVSALKTELTAADEASARIFNNSSRQVDQFQEKVTNLPGLLGNAVNDIFASIVGNKVELPIALDSAGIKKDLAEVATAFEQGDIAAAVNRAVRLHAATSIKEIPGSENLFEPLKVLNEARQQADVRITQVDGKLHKLLSFKRDDANNIQPVFGADAVGAPTDLKSIPIDVKVPTTDQIGRAISQALEALPPRFVQLEASFAPESVRAALELLRSKVGKPIDVFTAEEQGEVQAALERVRQGTVAQLGIEQLIAQSHIKVLRGLERQKAENDLIIAQMVKQIDLAEQQGASPADIKKAREAITPIKTAQGDDLSRDADAKRAELESLLLGLRVQSIEKTRQLAVQSGDVAKADALGLDLIKARALQQAVAADQQITNLYRSVDGYRVTASSVQEITDGIREQVTLDKSLAISAEARAKAERNRANAERISGIGAEALTGLDAELEKIRRNTRERVAGDKRDRENLTLIIDDASFAKVLDFYAQIERRDIALAKRNAIASRVDAIASALGSVTDSYEAQIQAIELARAAERDRVSESLRGSGAERAEIEATIALFDRLTQKQKEQATIQFAGTSALAIDEQIRLSKAYADATEASKLLGETEVQTAQRQVDALSRAREGVDALTGGFRAGITDAVRELNDLRVGADAGRGIVNGFRDSITGAFDSIGQKGTNIGSVLRDFGIANLKNLQHQAAEVASAQISKLFFKDTPNNPQTADERLRAAAQQLFDAGVKLEGAAGIENQRALNATDRAQSLIPSNVPTVEQNAEAIANNAKQDVTAAGQAFSSATTAAGQTVASSLIAGGNIAGSALSRFLGSVGNSVGNGLTSFLTKFITAGISGGEPIGTGTVLAPGAGGNFDAPGYGTVLAPEPRQHGGIIDHIVSARRYDGPSPRANAYGGLYSSRTLIEVSEVPGLKEAVIPLRDGRIPVQWTGDGAARAFQRQPNDIQSILDHAIARIPKDILEQQLARGPVLHGLPGGARPAPGSRAFPLDALERGFRGVDSPRERGGGGRGGDVTIHHTPGPVTVHMGSITIHATPGMDERAIAAQVSRQIAEQAPKAVTHALRSRSHNDLTNAIRDARE